jgi:hypothetical protein
MALSGRLLQRAMLRVYKQQMDAAALPYRPQVLAEDGLVELADAQAQVISRDQNRSSDGGSPTVRLIVCLLLI